MKVVKNNCYGGFGLSPLAVIEYARLKGFNLFIYHKEKEQYKRINEEQAMDIFSTQLFTDIVYSTKNCGDFCDNINKYYFSPYNIKRNDPSLVETVQKLGDKANTGFSDLIVVDIPDGIEWEIEDYDGIETIIEVGHTW